MCLMAVSEYRGLGTGGGGDTVFAPESVVAEVLFPQPAHDDDYDDGDAPDGFFPAVASVEAKVPLVMMFVWLLGTLWSGVTSSWLNIRGCRKTCMPRYALSLPQMQSVSTLRARSAVAKTDSVRGVAAPDFTKDDQGRRVSEFLSKLGNAVLPTHGSSDGVDDTRRCVLPVRLLCSRGSLFVRYQDCPVFSFDPDAASAVAGALC